MSRLTKSGAVCKAYAPGDADMALINAQALEPLAADDVFAFRVAMCDTRTDRAFERFSDEALGQMAALYVGRTVVKDHDPACDNQVARIYRCEVEDMGGYRALVGYAYTLADEAHAAFVAAIRGGILREVSVSFSYGTATCSVCGKNNVEGYCKHWPGREYEGKTCTYELSDVRDVYELSFVGVPCQRGAGVVKSYGDEPWEPGEDGGDEPREPGEDDCNAARALAIRARLAAGWAHARADGNGR